MENKDIFDNEWEQELPPENEMKQIQRTIRKRNWKIVAISVTLAAALLIGCVYGMIPLIESFYWHPGTENAAVNASDLTLTLHAYTELFCPGWDVNYINWQETEGLAAYDLQITIRDVSRKDYFRLDGKLEKGSLMYGPDFADNWAQHLWFTGFVLDSGSYNPDSGLFDLDLLSLDYMNTVREKLAQLPEYIALEAAITFTEDLNMEQVVQFHEDTRDLPLQISWVGIRNSPATDVSGRVGSILLCGMNPFTGGSGFLGVDETYPNFSLPLDYPYAESLERHFKSLLQYSSDQCAKGEGIPVWMGKDYYQTVLDYVEENGVMSYGAVVVASPETLLELLDQGVISHVTLLDAWIDIE